VNGYAGKILRVNLSRREVSEETIPENMKENFLGGRGFALKILWEEVRGADPLAEDNKVVFSTGPLTGLPVPSSGKMVIATKSPLTGGYVDSNIGGRASVHLRKAGYDALVVEGKAESPAFLSIHDDQVEILDARNLWGKNTFQAQEELEHAFGEDTGILLIGPGGERGVGFANVISQKGRAAGRGGIGAVLGSKNLKAIVLKGSKPLPVADEQRLTALGRDAAAEIKTMDNYDLWTRQGTMSVIEWANAISGLPTRNFREGVFPFAEQIGGDATEKIRVNRQGCPHCNAECGIVVADAGGGEAELDYENIAMLGANIGLGDLAQASALNRRADECGLDTISLGSCLAFLMEASEKGLLDEKLDWGDYPGCNRVIDDLLENRGLGEIVFHGVRKAAQRVGSGSSDWAMHVKGMEISGYTCQALPGMALAYGTSPIGAHHKDAFLSAWEVPNRFSYARDKVEKLIELQNLRGGWFEAMTVCRFPWIELGFGLHWYPKFMQAATGKTFLDGEIHELGDRFYALMRLYWVRETDGWSREMDVPPARWFNDSFTEGELAGSRLDREQYEQMLSWYYESRGWDENGIPTGETLKRLRLEGLVGQWQR
jgi:aldehyde:ferredoxin oxidoreductase